MEWQRTPPGLNTRSRVTLSAIDNESAFATVDASDITAIGSLAKLGARKYIASLQEVFSRELEPDTIEGIIRAAEMSDKNDEWYRLESLRLYRLHLSDPDDIDRHLYHWEDVEVDPMMFDSDAPHTEMDTKDIVIKAIATPKLMTHDVKRPSTLPSMARSCNKRSRRSHWSRYSEEDRLHRV